MICPGFFDSDVTFQTKDQIMLISHYATAPPQRTFSQNVFHPSKQILLMHSILALYSLCLKLRAPSEIPADLPIQLLCNQSLKKNVQVCNIFKTGRYNLKIMLSGSCLRYHILEFF